MSPLWSWHRCLGLLRGLVCFIVAVVLLPTSNARGGPEDEELIARAAAIHERVWTIDTHVDTPMRLVGAGFDIGQRHAAGARGGRVDLPRMREGGLDAIFFAVFLGQGERTAAGHAKARDETLQIFDAIHRAIAQYPDLAAIALNPDDAAPLEAQGKRAIYLGIENGYAIGNDLSLLATYFDRGARYVTLCHSRNNDICDSSTDEQGPEHHGLSAFGREVVREMNRLGMIVDVSHVSDETFYNVLDCTAAPVFASHSCARAVCDNPRNLSDQMLRRLAAQGGVIQICLLDAYVKHSPPHPERAAAIAELRSRYGKYEDLKDDQQREVLDRWEEINRLYPQSDASVRDVVDHIDHVVQVAGIEHVGIGTDFDGGGGLADCRDVSELGRITLELVRRGYTEEQIRKIWGGNFARVFRDVQRVAQEWQAKNP